MHKTSPAIVGWFKYHCQS